MGYPEAREAPVRGEDTDRPPLPGSSCLGHGERSPGDEARPLPNARRDEPRPNDRRGEGAITRSSTAHKRSTRKYAKWHCRKGYCH